MSDLSTIPATKQLGPGETKTLTIDLSASLGSGESISGTGLACSLTYMGQNGNVEVSYPAGLDGPPALSGNIVSQTVTNLSTANRYKLTVTFEIAPITSPPNVQQAILAILIQED